MMDRVMPTGRHHLGHGTNQRPGHPLLGDHGARTKRVSVLIGSHQLIGATRIKRVSVPNGDHRAPGTFLAAVKNEYLIFKDIYKGIHDDENNVCL